MDQPYFIVVFAHSMHGRLRRVHIPQQFVYLVLGLALLGGFSVFGFVSSYLRMTWKVANYNSLRTEVDSLRSRYAALQSEAKQNKQHLASLQLFANEVSLAYGIKQKLEGPAEISREGRLLPSMSETLEQYDFLKTANLSMAFRQYPRQFQTNVMPNLWPVNGRLLSSYGVREDPFSGRDAFHSGVDLSAITGTPVRAAADGIVLHAEWSGAYGRLVVIDHGHGIQTYYAHLSAFEVVPGQEIRRGNILGRSGATGRVSAPHLHYEVRMGGAPVNPYRYLAQSAIFQSASNTPKDLPF